MTLSVDVGARRDDANLPGDFLRLGCAASIRLDPGPDDDVVLVPAADRHGAVLARVHSQGPRPAGRPQRIGADFAVRVAIVVSPSPPTPLLATAREPLVVGDLRG